jgi:hypothetical protein
MKKSQSSLIEAVFQTALTELIDELGV